MSGVNSSGPKAGAPELGGPQPGNQSPPGSQGPPGSGIILRRLELHGFKSFADRTVLEFGPGIAAIVGPNGSGKSNLSEAFRWVLGEPSARQLRGSRMEDIIFAGSAGRRPVGLAQVTITLENTGGLALPFNEVSISRRVDRSGTSEFLLNGTPCRLRDIQQLLHDTGMGREAYSVVGQGQIDQVLNSRGEERRVLVEEVAGIIGFKARRGEALRRLTHVRHRLERLTDIVTELQDRITPLRGEAERARQHRLLQERLHQLEVQLSHSRAVELAAQAAGSRQAVTAAAGRLQAARQELASAEDRLSAGRRQLADVDTTAAALQQSLDDLAPELEEERSGLRVAEAARDHLAAEKERVQAELADLTQQLAALGERDESDHFEAETLTRELALRQERLATAAGAATAAAQRLTAARESLRQARQELVVLVQRHGAAQAEGAQLTARRDEVNERLTETAAGLRELAAAQAALTAAAEVAAADKSAAQTELAAAARRRAEAAAEQSQRQQRLAAAEQQVMKAQTAVDTVRSRRELLTDMQRQYEGYGRGVRTVMKGVGQGEAAFAAVIGTVAELLDIPTAYEQAIEAALGAGAQNLVTSTGGGAQQAVAELKRRGGGRATFLPLDSLSSAAPLPAHRNLDQAEGVLGWALALIACDPAHRAAAAHLLGRTLVVEDLTAARRVARLGEFRYRVVTLEGDLVHAGGAISGGSRRGDGRQTGLVARQRVLAEVDSLLTAATETLAAARAAAAAARKEVTAGQADLAAAADDERHREQVLATVRRRRDESGGQLVGLQREQGQLSARQEKLAQELDRLERRAAVAATTAADLGRELTALETRLAQLEAALSELEQQSQATAAVREQSQLELARTRHALDGRLALKERTASQRQDLTRAVAERQDRLTTLAQEQTAVEARLAAGRRAVADLTSRQAARRDDLTASHAGRQQLLAKIDTVEKALTAGRQAVDAARDEMHQRQIERDRLQVEHEHAVATWAAKVGFGDGDHGDADHSAGDPGAGNHRPSSVGPKDADGHDRAAAAAGEIWSPQQRQKVQRQVNTLRRQLADLGDVNPLAEGQLAQLIGREAFLSHQLTDLSQAAAGLTTAINLLETRMEILFLAAFKQLQERFDVVFKRLFGGGRATLTLAAPAGGTGDNDIEPAGGRGAAPGDTVSGVAAGAAGGTLAAGLEVSAQPPGKRLQPLSLLSGGERALTAIALLFALLEVRPTPFCVLDEIDSALDEVNQRRFTGYLTELSHRVQFIVATHRKITMAAADFLYGVSMGEAGVSRLVAVRMADAAAGAG